MGFIECYALPYRCDHARYPNSLAAVTGPDGCARARSNALALVSVFAVRPVAGRPTMFSWDASVPIGRLMGVPVRLHGALASQ